MSPKQFCITGGACVSLALLLGAATFATSSRGTGYRNLRDFDGDHITDLAVVKAPPLSNQAEWYIRRSSDGALSVQPWGLITDRMMVADFDGDGLADHTAVRRVGPAFVWYTRRSTDGGLSAITWGSSSKDTYFLLVGDFDADGKADVAVYRQPEHMFYVRKSVDGNLLAQPWGGPNNEQPVIGDWDGDGRSDFGVYGWNVWEPASSGRLFYLLQSGAGFAAIQWGRLLSAFDVDREIVDGDYDGDGKDDLAVIRLEQQNPMVWYVRQSSNGAMLAAQWGNSFASGDFPIHGDYDGDGRTDIAVYRAENTGYYFIRRTSDGGFVAIQWGGSSFAVVGTCQLFRSC